jgi:hypothetical protein
MAMGIRRARDEAVATDEIVGLDPRDDVDGKGKARDPWRSSRLVGQVELRGGCVFDPGFGAEVVAHCREQMRLDPAHEIEITHFSLASSVAFPKEVFKFSYTYTRSGKPISSVIIDLGDYSRHVSVTGNAEDQVKATSNLIEKDLRRVSTPIGGASFRRVAGLCLAVVFLASIGLSGAWWLRTRVYNALGMLICSTIGLLLVLLLPWDRYLPGFALYQSYSPFLLIRYAPQVFFLILVATLVGIPLSYFLPRRRERHPLQ